MRPAKAGSILPVFNVILGFVGTFVRPPSKSGVTCALYKIASPVLKDSSELTVSVEKLSFSIKEDCQP